MSITATFYNFSKKKNSTKLPENGTSYDIVIKEPSNILGPTIMLDRGNPVNLNYCYIPSFNRYYFIKDWTSDHGMWIASCTEDVLASWRESILNSTQYVLRSAVGHDTYIPNGDYIATKDVDVTSTELLDSLHSWPFSDNITYVMAISNNDNPGSKVNGVQYLFLTKQQINKVFNQLLNDNNTFGWGQTEADYGLTGSISRSIVNPLQYVAQCYTLPVALSEIGNNRLVNVSNIRVGFWPLGSIGEDVKAFVPNYPGNPVISKNFTLSLEQHPLSDTHGRWLNGYPYTNYRLYAGPFGSVDFNVDDILNRFAADGTAYTVYLNVKVDMFGKASLIVSTSSNGRGVVLAKRYADVAVPFSITQTKNGILSWGQSLIGTAASIMSGNIIGGVMSSNNLISGLDNAFPKPEVKGQTESLMCSYEPWTFETTHRAIATQHTIVAERAQITANLTGSPLCEVIRLGDLTGFTVCDNHIWLDIPAYSTEYDSIYSYLTNGFFIE